MFIQRNNLKSDHSTGSSISGPLTTEPLNLNSAKKLTLVVIFSTLMVLLIRSFLFAPQAPTRPHIIDKLEPREVLRGLDWYAKHSIGSLLVTKNRCLVKSNLKEVLCGEDLTPLKVTANLNMEEIISNKSLVPYIWKAKAYDKDIAFEFAIFELSPVNLLTHKERKTVLGSEELLEVEFRPTQITEIAKEILPENQLKKFQEEQSTNIKTQIPLLPNPYGYYLPIYPLPRTN